MYDIAKCANAEKYCKDCKTCVRHILVPNIYQCYSYFHNNKETNKDQCNYYIELFKQRKFGEECFDKIRRLND